MKTPLQIQRELGLAYSAGEVAEMATKGIRHLPGVLHPKMSCSRMGISTTGRDSAVYEYEPGVRTVLINDRKVIRLSVYRDMTVWTFFMKEDRADVYIAEEMTLLMGFINEFLKAINAPLEYIDDEPFGVYLQHSGLAINRIRIKSLEVAVTVTESGVTNFTCMPVNPFITMALNDASLVEAVRETKNENQN